MPWLFGLMQLGTVSEVGTHLNIQDSFTGEHVPVGGIVGYDGDYLQTVVAGYAGMVLERKGVGLGVGNETSYRDCKRKTEIVIKILCSDNVSIGARIKLRDAFGEIMYLPNQTLTQTGITENGQYLAELHLSKTYGAAEFAVRVTSLASGTADIWLASV